MTAKRTTLFLALGAILVLAEVVRVAWFQWRAPSWQGDPLLTLALPADGTPGFERLELDETRGGQALAYDYGDLVRLYDPDRASWSMDLYYLEYEAGNGRQLTDLFVHSPEVCLRASGSRLTRTLPRLEAEVDGHFLQARHLVFEHPINDREFHVFKLVWLAQMEKVGISGEENDFRKVRLKAAWGRLPRPPARLILTSMSGVRSDQEARALFRQEIVKRCFFKPADR